MQRKSFQGGICILQSSGNKKKVINSDSKIITELQKLWLWSKGVMRISQRWRRLQPVIDRLEKIGVMACRVSPLRKTVMEGRKNALKCP